MDKLKEKLSRLMYGRYGIDQLGNFMMWAAVAMMIFDVCGGAAVVQQGNHSGRPGRGLWTAGGGWRGDGVRLYGE